MDIKKEIDFDGGLALAEKMGWKQEESNSDQDLMLVKAFDCGAFGLRTITAYGIFDSYEYFGSYCYGINQIVCQVSNANIMTMVNVMRQAERELFLCFPFIQTYSFLDKDNKEKHDEIWHFLDR